MKIIIRTKNLELTSQINNYLEKKIKHLEKFNLKIFKAQINLIAGKEHSSDRKFRVEINLFLPGKIIRGESSGLSIFAATDLVLEKLEKQLKRYKNKK